MPHSTVVADNEARKSGSCGDTAVSWSDRSAAGEPQMHKDDATQTAEPIVVGSWWRTSWFNQRGVLWPSGGNTWCRTSWMWLQLSKLRLAHCPLDELWITWSICAHYALVTNFLEEMIQHMLQKQLKSGSQHIIIKKHMMIDLGHKINSQQGTLGAQADDRCRRSPGCYGWLRLGGGLLGCNDKAMDFFVSRYFII